ncbi:hypothetical protein [Plantactinospora sp. CA-290183]|uniref:hypothetical protein n=1 Tax=Plantactinospora sp. CA-290183 TaxID=3240006 RepID=UPI003D92055D
MVTSILTATTPLENEQSRFRASARSADPAKDFDAGSWHVPTRQTIAPLRPTTGIRTLMFSGDGRRLVTWGDTFEHDEDWGVSLWDIDTGARIG